VNEWLRMGNIIGWSGFVIAILAHFDPKGGEFAKMVFWQMPIRIVQEMIWWF